MIFSTAGHYPAVSCCLAGILSVYDEYPARLFTGCVLLTEENRKRNNGIMNYGQIEIDPASYAEPSRCFSSEELVLWNECRKHEW